MLTFAASPWFCHDLECPPFNGTQATNYSIRTYPSSRWASTSVASTDFTKATSTGFYRLFNYIDGQNVEKKKIPMTAPVLNKVQASQGPFCNSNFTISFYMPFLYQPWYEKREQPPTPSSSDVFVQDYGTLRVAVLEFSGFVTNDMVTSKAAELAEALKKDQVPFETAFFFYAGYDPPYRIINRHNEVWFVLQK